jgi:hypothetical protein
LFVSTDGTIDDFNRASELEVCVEKQIFREIAVQPGCSDGSRVAVFCLRIMGAKRSASAAIQPV